MPIRATLTGALAAAFLLSGAGVRAQTAVEFYKGKTINIIVGFGAGGGYDLYARLVGRFIGEYIPGNPKVVVQNMDGAGSVRAANYVYTGAPKDGTVIAAVNQNMPMYQLLGGKAAQFDAAKMTWLGTMGGSNGLLYTWHTSKVKTIEDAMKTPVKEVHLAMERGEVEGRGGNSWSSLLSSNRDWVEQKKLNFLVQIGFEPEPELRAVPMLQSLMKTDDERKIVDLVSLPTVLGYAQWVAPEVPADRVETLRAAYAATMKDPGFLAETRKLGVPLRPDTGAAVETLVKRVANTPKPVLLEAARLLEWKD